MLVNNREKNYTYYESRSGTSDYKASEKEWRRLWQVKVPSKIRVFFWRLAQSSLSSRDVLHHRNMAKTDVCAICVSKDSWKHSLIDCMAKCVWALEKEDITYFIGVLQ
jgi:hypothetical protein